MIIQFVEVYINDVVVKSPFMPSHLSHLSITFERMIKYKMKMKILSNVLLGFMLEMF